MREEVREEVREVHVFSNHRPNPRYSNAFTVDEVQYLQKMPVSDFFGSSHRPVLGSGRNILHAAAIFDPGFLPPSIQYQLPPRLGRYVGERGQRGDGLENEEIHRRNDSGYESDPYAFVADEDEDDGVKAWCDAVLAQESLIEPNQHILRPDAPSFRPGTGVYRGIHVDNIRKELREASPVHDEGIIPGHNTVVYSSSSQILNKRQGQNRRFAVTDYELKVLDYEGLNSRLKSSWRDAQSEGAESEVDEDTYDDHFEVGSRSRWSV